MVLRYNAKLVMDKSTANKLVYCWEGPYQVREANQKKGMYILEEFDGTLVPGTCLGNRLKKFIKQEGFYEPVSSDTQEEVRDEKEEEEESEEENEAVDGDLAGSMTSQPRPDP